MTRNIAWVVAALLLTSAPGRAAGLHDVSTCEPADAANCERAQAAQQRGTHPPAGAKPESKPDSRPGQRPEPVKWWIDARRRAELSITDQQSAAVEAVWQKSAPALHDGRAKLMKLEDVLSKLTDGNDEAAVIAQSDQVEKLRAELSSGRTLMIYRMNLILTPDQRAKVKAMYHPDPGRRGASPR